MALSTGRRILVVEDQAINRDLVTMVLRKLHYHVDAVASGEAALARLAAAPYALVLLDRSLPDMDGLELARRLRAEPGRGSDVPVIILGEDDGDERAEERLREAGAQGRLVKPVQIDRLLGMVRRLTASRGGRREAAAEPPLPVDLEHLLAFTDGDAQLERELAVLFLSTARVYLERMGRAIETDQEWVGAAHALRGASANLGATRVAALAAGAEDGTPDQATLAELLHAVEEVQAFFERRGTRVG